MGDLGMFITFVLAFILVIWNARLIGQVNRLTIANKELNGELNELALKKHEADNKVWKLQSEVTALINSLVSIQATLR